MVLSDSYRVAPDAEGHDDHHGRGTKHRLDDDQMSVESVNSKRPDVSTSGEKNKHSKSKAKPPLQSKFRNKSKN